MPQGWYVWHNFSLFFLKIKIHQVNCDTNLWTMLGGQDVDRLPSASTCYNTLKVLSIINVFLDNNYYAVFKYPQVNECPFLTVTNIQADKHTSKQIALCYKFKCWIWTFLMPILYHLIFKLCLQTVKSCHVLYVYYLSDPTT